MSGIFKIKALLLLSVVLAACSPPPEDYESAPVTLNTDRGEVVCQLYTKEIVLWDRALKWPDSMSYKDADRICKAEGKRRLDEGA